MRALLLIGLLVSLAASPLALALCKRLRFASWALVPRLALWLSAIVVVVIAAAGVGDWLAHLGFAWPTWSGIGWAVLAAVVVLGTLGVSLQVQRKAGKQSQRQSVQYQALLNLPFWHRCFIVITAAVTEEVLYRAYAVGVGQLLLGSVWVACVLSVAAFTLAHYKWGIVHMLSVLVPAIVFTLLFVFTRNIWLCIIAHAIVDGAGFLAVPAAARRRTQLQQKAG
jgi:membrane protease YdiL (CAAX protease family)